MLVNHLLNCVYVRMISEFPALFLGPIYFSLQFFVVTTSCTDKLYNTLRCCICRGIV